METTSTEPSGGCFSALVFPLPFIFGLFVFLRMATGETTRPWDLMVDPKPMEAQSFSANNLSEDHLLASFFTPSVLFWERDIIRWAEENGLDPNLVATVMQIESCGDPNALSHAGAMGLFQVMPYHFQEKESPYDPNTNAIRGMAYLEKSLATHNTVRLALAGYNGGIGTASKSENDWPRETIRYTYWGTGIYSDATSNKNNSPRLEEWLGAGGASLCRQAEERLGIKP